ncbi:hypothetical protein [Nitrosomonas sp. Nm58]|nr:hypothetical protein [Nitrosomonas sp. Nm58]SDY71862.1 hypothetical protein SAMN05421754_10196 [Nitrosomonas sp. Nm58]
MLNKEKELPATKYIQKSYNFPDVKKRTVEVSLQGGDISVLQQAA